MTKQIAGGIRAWLDKQFAEVELSREQMHEYQGTAHDFLIRNPFSALFIDMGLGKTVTCGTLIADLLDDLDFEGKVLIVAPLRVATQTWPDEFRKWRHLAHLSPSVIHVDDDDPRLKEAAARGRAMGRAESHQFKSQQDKAVRENETRMVAQMREKIRMDASRHPSSVHIISADWIEWLVAQYNRKGAPWPYKTIIIDESSGFKNHNAARFIALKLVRDQPGFVTRLHLLTATPAAETYEHLFAQIYLLDRGQRFGREIGKFRDRYFIRPHQRDPSRKWKLRPDAEKEILAKISDICLVMKAKDYLEMEEPLYVTREVRMTEAQATLYRTMQEDMVVTLDDGSEISADTAASLSAKLLQMASGVLYETQLKPGQEEDDDHVKILKVHNIHTHKLDELEQIVEEAQGQPILVGYHFRASKDRLKQRFGDKITFMDAEGKCKRAWNAGKIPILAMHPKSGGHGLNLQAGGHIIVWYDIPWSLELYQQFIGRLARQGQKHRVSVFHLVTRGTLDEAVVSALAMKDDAQEKLFKILKRMRAKLRKLLKGKKAVKPGEAEWDKVVDVLTAFADLDDDMESKGVVIHDGLDGLETEPEHCPNCGDIGGPCGPGSDCYDEL